VWAPEPVWRVWRKFLTLQDSNSDPSVVQPAASRYTDYAIPVPLEVVRIILNRFNQVVVWIQLAQNMVQWRESLTNLSVR
jgi:hypothetical protein